MARVGYVVGGLVMMLFLSWMAAIVIFSLFPIGIEGLVVGSMVGLFVGFIIFITGFIVFVYGLVAKSDLEKAVLMKSAADLSISMRAETQSSITCQNCLGENQPHARFCISCGEALF